MWERDETEPKKNERKKTNDLSGAYVCIASIYGFVSQHFFALVRVLYTHLKSETYSKRRKEIEAEKKHKRAHVLSDNIFPIIFPFGPRFKSMCVTLFIFFFFFFFDYYKPILV